ncbi:hypothetical protein CHUV0807_2518 [Cardiobacterium hominis]|uniref:Uncharacterized protein n=1 Tax=Cardiobacterium hominis TaxID=2718 RepID=A0A1C3H7D0_9GAMM|nr:hypothetical protein CHUV0807_2518 [Cardiobacterium hominis]
MAKVSLSPKISPCIAGAFFTHKTSRLHIYPQKSYKNIAIFHGLHYIISSDNSR